MNIKVSLPLIIPNQLQPQTVWVCSLSEIRV